MFVYNTCKTIIINTVGHEDIKLLHVYIGQTWFIYSATTATGTFN